MSSSCIALSPLPLEHVDPVLRESLHRDVEDLLRDALRSSESFSAPALAELLLWSIKHHSRVCFELLLHRGAGFDAKTPQGQTALHLASLNQDPFYLLKLPTFSDIINEIDLSGYSALHVAANRGNARIVSDLIKDPQIDLHQLTPSLQNAIHLAAGSWSSETSECLQILLQTDIHAMACDIDGRTPLMLAAKRGVESAVRILLERGVDSAVRDFQGRDAKAIATLQGFHSLASYLMNVENIRHEKTILEQIFLPSSVSPGLLSALSPEESSLNQSSKRL